MTDIRAVCWEAISCLSGRAKGCGNVCKKSLWKTGSCRRGTFWWPFPVFEILAYCSFTSRGNTVTNEDYSKTKQVPLQNESVYISQAETNITKESHTTLDRSAEWTLSEKTQVTKLRLGVVLHLFFVEDGVPYQVTVDTHWIIVSFERPHVINLFLQLIFSVFYSR